MKYIHNFDYITEKSIQQASAELKSFQKLYNASVSFDDVLKSVEAMKVSLYDIFPSLIKLNDIESVPVNTVFKSHLRAKKMRIGEIYDTRDSSTLLSLDVKFLMIYNRESMDLDTPNYLLVQRAKSKKSFSKSLELYYVQDDITKFFDSLTTLVLSIEHQITDSSCLYKSSNSGEDWNLYRNSSDSSYSFKSHMDWSDIEELKKLNYNITVYFDDK